MLIQPDKVYVVKVRDGTHADILHEYTKRERVIYNIKVNSITALKILVVIVSILIPPLLLVTMPMMRKSEY